MATITATLPTSESVLQFEPEELAAYLLEHLVDHPNDLHFNNLVSNSIRHNVVYFGGSLQPLRAPK